MGSFSSNDLATQIESSLPPCVVRSDSTSDFETDVWRRWASGRRGARSQCQDSPVAGLFAKGSLTI